MLKVDNSILTVDAFICEAISKSEFLDRGFISQSILGHIRNFVEYIAIKEYARGNDLDPNDYEKVNCPALKYIKSIGNLRFLYRFHQMLQKSASHYTVDKDGSERLMLKYYEHLLKVKTFLKEKYQMEVLHNIQDFPLNNDTELLDYYVLIAEKIERPGPERKPGTYNDRYYIQKVKPFFVNQKIYYEVTFTDANAEISKFDRAIAFTKLDLMDNYAVKLSIHSDTIQIYGKKLTLLFIDNYEVSIRPCELKNLAKILGFQINISASSTEYKVLMQFLTTVNMPLSELVESEQDYYNFIRLNICRGQSSKICDILDLCRDLIMCNKPGANILRYLLYKLNNRILKLQSYNYACLKLSDLFLQNGCIPFDEMPFCTSLIQHNPSGYDLFLSIPSEDREHEFLARRIKHNTETEGHLFTPLSELETFSDISGLIQKYNNKLFYGHINRQLAIYKNHIYIQEYANDCTCIIRRLMEYATDGIKQYTASVDSWISKSSYIIDDENKRNTLRNMFSSSHVSMIYGSAGTGKSTLINHIANFWSTKEKLFLANTHPALDNLRNRVNAANSNFSTISSFINKSNNNPTCDILFIDECSTVSNHDMRRILEKAAFRLLVLVGDTYQIESISFGNWFDIARMFLPETTRFELKTPYRTTDDHLIELWNRVRTLDYAILELLVKYKYVARLDESVFEKAEEDEIVLCLNYDGLYGINNINRLLQHNNPEQAVNWGVHVYKVGDPILFNESRSFSPLIHNNSKGKIVGISKTDNYIEFDIELDKAINEFDAFGYNFEVIGISETGNSVISFRINKNRSTDEDDDDNNSTIVPFQIAYAVSIHKAQSLEYDSVKIIITNEVEERITHNVFYTAITRAKKKILIYWSPETENSILGNLKSRNSKKDAYLLAQLSELNILQDS